MKNKIFGFWRARWVVGLILVLLVIFVGCVIASYLQRFGGIYGGNQDVWGQFGDYVGGVLNPVLSFCAFVGLIFTLRFQTAESVKVERRQTEQQFDARLFQMLSLLNTSLSSVQIDAFNSGVKQSVIGHGAIKIGWKKLESGLKQLEEVDMREEALNTRFLDVFRGWSDTFGDRMISYYDTLLFMLLYVRKESEGENQKFALRAISSQLGQEARLLLFYMMLFSGNKSMYCFLEHHGYWPGADSSVVLPHAHRLVKILKESR